MPATLYHLDLTRHLFNLRNAPDQLPHPSLILAIQPFRIVLADVHRAPEYVCPLQMRSIEVRMADDDGLQPAFSVNKVNGIRVQQSDTVPEHIALGRLEQDGALTDTQLLACSA